MSRVPMIGMAALALVFSAASAQTTTPTTQTPLTQGITSVDKNLERDPDNKGLQTASERLRINQERLEEQKAKTATRVEEAKAQQDARSSRPDFAQRPVRIERPQAPMRGGR
jgi:hypothetical protein